MLFAGVLLILGLSTAAALLPGALARRGARAARANTQRILASQAGTANLRTAWACSELGKISCLEKQLEAVPEVGDDEVRVDVRAIGLNYADVFCVLGLYEAANKMLEEQGDGASLCPGLEFAGVVSAVGARVGRVAVGQRVYGFTRFGAYRTSVVVRERLVRPMPETWSFNEAAALLVQGLTAWHGLVELGGARKGSRVLVHSAAGGVGSCALEICSAIGADAVGVVGSPHKVDFLRERFPRCTPLVRSSERRYAAQLAEVGFEYDVVLESLGGKYLTGALDRVAPMGRLVHFGATAAYGGSIVDGLFKWIKLVPNFLRRPFVDPGELVPKNRALMGFNLIWLTEREDKLERELDEMLTTGGLASRPPAVGRTFPFDELPAALRYLQSGASVGKVVVEV